MTTLIVLWAIISIIIFLSSSIILFILKKKVIAISLFIISLFIIINFFGLIIYYDYIQGKYVSYELNVYASIDNNYTVTVPYLTNVNIESELKINEGFGIFQLITINISQHSYKSLKVTGSSNMSIMGNGHSMNWGKMSLNKNDDIYLLHLNKTDPDQKIVINIKAYENIWYRQDTWHIKKNAIENGWHDILINYTSVEKG